MTGLRVSTSVAGTAIPADWIAWGTIGTPNPHATNYFGASIGGTGVVSGAGVLAGTGVIGGTGVVVGGAGVVTLQFDVPVSRFDSIAGSVLRALRAHHLPNAPAETWTLAQAATGRRAPISTPPPAWVARVATEVSQLTD